MQGVHLMIHWAIRALRDTETPILILAQCCVELLDPMLITQSGYSAQQARGATRAKAHCAPTWQACD